MDIMKLKEEYNKTVARLKKAEEWFETAPAEKLEEGEKKLMKVLDLNRRIMNELRRKGVEFDTETVLEGFKI